MVIKAIVSLAIVRIAKVGIAIVGITIAPMTPRKYIAIASIEHLGDEVVELDEIRARLPLGAVHLLRLVAPLVRVRVGVRVRVRVTLTCFDSSRPCRE